MAKKTLLQMVQNILSAMDSDEVNSISDTVEAMQVAEIVRETYEELVSTLDIPEERKLVHLEGSSDITRPNYMRVPDNVKKVLWVQYNKVDVNYLPPKEFVDKSNQAAGSLVTVLDFNGVSYQVPSDKDPQWFTTFDDQYFAFDSYNKSLDSTLQGSKSLAHAEMNSEFQMVDTYTPNLNDNFFPTLLAGAKNTCFVNLKQVNNADAQSRERRGLVRIQNSLNRTSMGNPADRLPNYGRRR